MKSWNRPGIPALPGAGSVPLIWDTSEARLVAALPPAPEPAQLYVCGITPYDATHVGHAATFLAYDGLIRLWRDAGQDVRYVQNSTDVDDPLLERATATGADWRELAEAQTDLFRRDMESLSIIPPDEYVAVTDMIEPTADAVKVLLDSGIGYFVDGDVYFDSAAAAASGARGVWNLGDESRLDRATMLALSAERGGDPERPGKRDRLDPLLWRSARPGEPSWNTVLGAGRPGWHIECAVIAERFLSLPATVTAGGADLVFPHHEFSAGHAAALTGTSLSVAYSHAGLVSYQGSKMSKSLGNLVLISTLTDSGTDPRSIRLALLAQHYRESWEWTDSLLLAAQHRLARWQAWAVPVTGAAACSRDAQADPDADVVSAPVTPLLRRLREVLRNDLDFPTAVRAVDESISAGSLATRVDIAAIDALLGIRLG